MLIGRAFSNVFDGVKTIPADKPSEVLTLKGIPKQSTCADARARQRAVKYRCGARSRDAPVSLAVDCVAVRSGDWVLDAV